MFILRAIWAHLPLKAWLYLGAVLAVLGGYIYWQEHERAIGEAKCEAAQAEKQAKIDALQSEVDAGIAAYNANLHARYDALTPKANTYEPINLAGCDCKLPADIVRSVNAAHARK